MQSVTRNPLAAAEAVALIEAWTPGTDLPGAVDDRITILCCTDAKRDAYCVRFDFATFRRLSQAPIQPASTSCNAHIWAAVVSRPRWSCYPLASAIAV